MPSNHQIRAWKDLEYRATLSEADVEAAGQHPAGPSILADTELDRAAGAYMGTQHLLTIGCCGGFTTDPTLCSFSCQSAQCNTNTLI